MQFIVLRAVRNVCCKSTCLC